MGEIRADQHQLVIFFDDYEVCRQMLIEEFESVLDGFVPLVDCKGRQQHCVFLLVDVDLSIDAAVFFKLPFDLSGRPDVHWNTPIAQLASQAGPASFDAAGPRVASYSQCSIAWHQQKLWDPQGEHFVALHRVIAENKLGLGRFKPNHNTTTELARLDFPGVDASADAPKHTVLGGDRAAQLDSTKNQQDEIERLQKLLEAQRRQLQKMGRQQTALVKQHEQLRDVTAAQVQEKARLIKQKLEHRWREVLDIRQAEVKQGRQHLDEADRAYGELELRYQNAVQGRAEDLLAQLNDAGVKFHAEHAGGGSIHIPKADLLDYLAAPTEYIAARSGVDVERYEQWLLHREQPICGAHEQDGSRCQAGVTCVLELDAFAPGYSDRCTHHKESSKTASVSV